MEWSKDKTLKLIGLLQVNANLWNPSLCYTRRDKQKRREELRTIADILGISVADATKKIQHLRTQYNREWAWETRASIENPNDRYVSSWYAYNYVHFLKDSNKPYKVLPTEDNPEVNGLNSPSDSISKHSSLSPPHKISRTDPTTSISFKSEANPSNLCLRDDFSVFGEYVANELRSLKGEKNLLIAKKKILDVIFEVKINSACDQRHEQTCTVFTPTPRHSENSIHSDKVYTTPTITTAQIEPLTVTHTTPTSGISEIIINSECHYSNFKVDTQ